MRSNMRTILLLLPTATAAHTLNHMPPPPSPDDHAAPSPPTHDSDESPPGIMKRARPPPHHPPDAAPDLSDPDHSPSLAPASDLPSSCTRRPLAVPLPSPRRPTAVSSPHPRRPLAVPRRHLAVSTPSPPPLTQHNGRRRAVRPAAPYGTLARWEEQPDDNANAGKGSCTQPTATHPPRNSDPYGPGRQRTQQ